jgi:hypothetical protein
VLGLFVNLGLVNVVLNFLYFFRDAQVLDQLQRQKLTISTPVYGIHWLISHDVTRLHVLSGFQSG